MKTAATQEPKMTGQTITASMIYFGATIQTQANGYHVVLMHGERKGGLVSLVEAQAYILRNRTAR